MAVNNVIRMLNLTRGLNTDGDVDADSLSDNFVSNNFFQSQPSGLASPLSVNVYTSGSGNYTVPAGATFVYGFALGGGGGGGGNQMTQANYGGGGGSGSGAYFSFSATAGSAIAYSVGSGGTAGGDVAGFGSTASTGATGGSTTFGSNVTVGGGVGGTGGTPNVGGTGGAEGTASGSAVAFAKSGASGTDNPGTDWTTVAGGAQTITFTPSAYIIYNQGDANTIGSSSILSPSNNASAGGASSQDGQNGYLIVYAFG